MTPGPLDRSGEPRQAPFWTLNLCDGRHAPLDVAERAELPFAVIAETAEGLLEAGLPRESP